MLLVFVISCAVLLVFVTNKAHIVVVSKEELQQVLI